MKEKFNKQDIQRIAAYKESLVGPTNDDDDDQPTDDIKRLLDNEPVLKLAIQADAHFLAFLMRILVWTLVNCALQVQENQAAIDCKHWSMITWCNFLSLKIEASQNLSPDNPINRSNAIKLVQRMEGSLAKFQFFFRFSLPQPFRTVNNLQDWIAQIRLAIVHLNNKKIQLQEEQRKITDAGWNRMFSCWYPEDHRVWIYRFWDEVFEMPIPNRPNYPPI